MAPPAGRLVQRTHLVVVGVVVVVLALSICITLATVFATGHDQSHAAHLPPSSGIFGRYAVSSEAAECAEVGKEILDNGGSAVDAAIAASLCGGLHHPQSAGIGGGSFMVIYNENNSRAEVIDFRETAPKFSHRAMYARNATLSLMGGLSVAVPGEIAGYLAAWRKYGRLSWAALFNRTIEICERGVPLNQYTASNLANFASQLVINAPFREDFFRDGRPLETGQMVHRPRLCKTLRTIASDPQSFYNGSLVDDILQDVNEEGGNLTASDLREYSVKFRDALGVRLQSANLTLFTTPPPSIGALLGMAIKVLSGYNLTSRSLSSDAKDVRTTSITLHRVVEAFKWAFAQRSQFGEAVNNTLIERFKSDEWSAFVRQHIADNRTFNDSQYYMSMGEYPRFDSGTQQTSAVDGRGLAVSMTSTVNTEFGSKKLGRRTGIIFNNEMDDFSTSNVSNYHNLPPSPSNEIEPGRRPVSSMCPSIVVDGGGHVRLVVGAGGGPRIVTATAWTILNHLIFNKTLIESVTRPRLHHQFKPNVVNFEEGIAKEYREELQKRGHVLEKYEGRRPGFVQAIARVRGQWHAVSDERKRGGVAGN